MTTFRRKPLNPNSVTPIKGDNPLIKTIAENWFVDAGDEDEKYFFFYDEVEQIMNGRKNYVIGRKGSGKTAIREYILKQASYDTFCQKLNFKHFPFNELYALSDDSFTAPNQYITIWKYIIYSQVCKMMRDNEAIDNTLRTTFEQLYPKHDKKQLKNSIAEWTKVGFGLNILGNGGNIEIGRELKAQKSQWIDKVDLLENIIIENCDSSKYYILFDELDEDFRSVKTQGDDDLYMQLLTSLFKAVHDIKRVFKDSGVEIIPVVFLRDDIYSLIKDPDKNKWRDFVVELEWDIDKLQRLLTFRLTRDSSRKQKLSFKQAWELIFDRRQIFVGTGKHKAIPSNEFVRQSTHLRPRDYIKYLKLCCEEAIKQGERFISPSTVKKCDRAFSNYLWDEIKDEIFPLLPDLDEIRHVIEEMRCWIFSPEDFKNAYLAHVNDGSIKESNVNKVLDCLFNFSVLGTQNAHQSEVKYFKYKETNMTRNPREKLVVHRGLLKTFQII